MNHTAIGTKHNRRMRLTDTNVKKIMEKCIYPSSNIPKQTSCETSENAFITVEGIANNFTFDAKMLADEKKHIEELLDNLPVSFSEGRPFLEMYCTHTGRAWTNSPKTLEKLVALGLAIGKVSYTHPKSIWWSLSGGMPYVTIQR